MAERPVVALICVTDALALTDYFERRGCDVRRGASDWAIQPLLDAGGIDVAIVGEQLASMACLDLLRKHVKPGGPDFVVVSKRSDTIDKVLALELGAADYLTAPVETRELAARVANLMSRRGKKPRDLAMFETTTVDLKAALVMLSNGSEEQLSAGQVALLRFFLRNPRRVLSRDELIAAAPAETTDAFDRSIDSRILRLRRKLETETITTVRGSGYRYDPI